MASPTTQRTHKNKLKNWEKKQAKQEGDSLEREGGR